MCFIGIYWQNYGWVAPGEDVSGLEDEYRLSGNKPKLIYIKAPAPDRQPRLTQLLDRIRADDHVSYKSFRTAPELRGLVADDLAVLLTERFASARSGTPELEHSSAATLPFGSERKRVPIQFTSFVGREAELAEISGWSRYQSSGLRRRIPGASSTDRRRTTCWPGRGPRLRDRPRS